MPQDFLFFSATQQENESPIAKRGKKFIAFLNAVGGDSFECSQEAIKGWFSTEFEYTVGEGKPIRNPADLEKRWQEGHNLYSKGKIVEPLLDFSTEGNTVYAKYNTEFTRRSDQEIIKKTNTIHFQFDEENKVCKLVQNFDPPFAPNKEVEDSLSSLSLGPK